MRSWTSDLPGKFQSGHCSPISSACQACLEGDCVARTIQSEVAGVSPRTRRVAGFHLKRPPSPRPGRGLDSPRHTCLRRVADAPKPLWRRRGFGRQAHRLVRHSFSDGGTARVRCTFLASGNALDLGLDFAERFFAAHDPNGGGTHRGMSTHDSDRLGPVSKRRVRAAAGLLASPRQIR